MRRFRLLALLATSAAAACARSPSLPSPGDPWETAAHANATSLSAPGWAPFGRPEQGWAVYAPAVAQEIGSDRPADTPAFAARLAEWQRRAGRAADGVMTPETLGRMKAEWQGRRPFLRLRAAGVCPAPPDDARLSTAEAAETLGSRPVRLRTGALAAYRAMVAAAREAEPAIAVDPRLLTLFSGYRDPEGDAARCLSQANCDGVGRAVCSAHRTGLALDLMVGAAPGFNVDSTADENRLVQARGVAYRWLLANAARFGFVNYPFEPWHWEWTGEAP